MDSEQFKYSEFMRFMNKVSDGDVKIESSQQPISHSWTEEFDAQASGDKSTVLDANQESDWVQDFAEHKAKQGKKKLGQDKVGQEKKLCSLGTEYYVRNPFDHFRFEQ